ncbi:MAG TPA: CapA family protein [Gemmatimonadales bacterium]|nr:CapA family protein [Gemmatimonadales bacterium]
MSLSRLAARLVVAGAVAGCSTTPPPESPRPVPVPAPDTVGRPVQPAPVRVPELTPPTPRSSVRFAFVGDINLGTLTLPAGVPPDSGRHLLAAARPHLTGDLVVGNFEGVLGDSGTTYKCGTQGVRVGYAEPPAPPPPPIVRRRKPAVPPAPEPPRLCYSFLTPTHLAPSLKDAGFTHLNLANNHANDFGAEARTRTEAIFDSLGLRHYGPLGRVSMDTVRRGDSVTTVALIGFTTYPYAYDLLDIPRSAAVVDSLRPLADLVVVTFHGGAEGSRALHVPEAAESLAAEPRGDLRRWARAVIDAGADAVVGHGPHVLRGIEFYGGKPIVYSLGNFLTYRGFNLAGPLGITGVLQLELDGSGGFRGGRLVPMVQAPRAGPQDDPSRAALDLVRTLSREDFPFTGAAVDPDGRILPPPAP